MVADKQSQKIQRLALLGAAGLTEASLRTLLLDRVMFPSKISDGAGGLKLEGRGKYAVIVKSMATFRKSASGEEGGSGVGANSSPGEMRVKWLYVEWRGGPKDSAADKLLIASGDWKRGSDGKGDVTMDVVGLAAVDDSSTSIKLERGAHVTVRKDAVFKVRDLSERQFYALVAGFNGLGRDGYSFQTGLLSEMAKSNR